MSKKLEYFRETHTDGSGKWSDTDIGFGRLNEDKQYWVEYIGPVIVNYWYIDPSNGGVKIFVRLKKEEL